MSLKPLKVNMVSASDLYGGAGIASYRLLQGLENVGVETKLYVQDRKSSHENVSGPHSWICRGVAKLLPYVDPLPKLLYRKRHRGAWSCGLLPNPCLPMRQLQNSDVIHFHWVGGGMVPIRAVSELKRPIVWTLHDAWPFTGGCHIPYECKQYIQMCGDCPQLRSRREHDLSRVIWKRKSQQWGRLQMSIVAPSQWLASIAASSGLFKEYPIQVIPNGLDLRVFSPFEKQEARKILGLPHDACLLLFSAFTGIANWNKGGDLLRQSLHLLQQNKGQEIILLMTGSQKAPADGYFPVPVVNLGVIDDDRKKRLIYSAADVTVVPSRSESLGYVAMESMACGTPCVSFAVGGLLDVISHCENGYLAEAFSVQDFARGIQWIFNDPDRWQRVSRNARQTAVENYDHLEIARKYESVYRKSLRSFQVAPTDFRS